MTRLVPILQRDMTDAQRSIVDSLVNGERALKDSSNFLNEDGSLRGPFDPMLRAPKLGAVLEPLGAAVRYQTSLSDHVREVAILTCARHWRSNFEWCAHRQVAQRQGLADEVIEAIMSEQEPQQPDLNAAYRFVYQLNKTSRVEQGRYAKAIELFDEQGVTELTILSGYYATVAQLLNVFQIPMPGADAAPFEL